MRAFIAIKLPPKILMEIKSIQENLPFFSGKKTELKNLHLTLKFFGEISSEKIEEIKFKLRKIKFNKFESEIKDIGFFDNPERGIVWLGITDCENIQKQIDNSLEGLYEKENRFMGHLTIARTRKISDKKKFTEDLKKIKISKMFFVVEKFYLMESNLKKEGPEYNIIEEYFLN
jgi:2'-5' RNA ligase